MQAVMRLAPFLAVAALLFAPAASACGKEFWAKKTLTDPAASSIDWRPVDKTVAELSAVPPRTGPTRGVFERRVYRVHATLTALKTEADGDVHLVLEQAGHSMVAESPLLGCTVGAQHRYRMAQARRFIDRRWVPGNFWRSVYVPVVVTGVGLFDVRHGQRGVAANGFELHPVLTIR